MIVAVVLLGVLCLVLGGVVIFRARSPGEQNTALLIKQDITTLSQAVDQLKDNLQSQITDRLDKNQEMMRTSIQKQFSESSKLIGDVTERLTRLDETNKRVVSVADELKSLQNVLQNPKQRGVLGEYYLEQVLQNVLPPDRFKMQYKFKDGEIVDAVIILDKGKLLPIDSKFSLENYNRLIEEKDADRRGVHQGLFKADLKKRIDETAKYIRPNENTMDYAFMFIPSEAIYYDLLINKIGATGTNTRDLLEYAFREKNIIIVSPTTFMAYLQTVLQGLRGLQIEEQAKEIQIRVGQLGKHISSYEQLMQKLGGSLSSSVTHYNNAHRELGKIDKTIVKVSGGDTTVAPILLDRPNATDEDA